MSVTCDKMLVTLINATVRLDDAVKTSPHREVQLQRTFMRGSMMKFLNKCGEPLKSCRSCKSVFPWDARKRRQPTTSAEKRAAGGLRLVKIGGFKVPWGERIEVSGRKGIPVVNYEIPTAMEYLDMTTQQRNAVRGGIRRALQIKTAAGLGQTLQGYLARQAALKSGERKTKRIIREKQAQRVREKEAKEREGRKATREEKAARRAGAQQFVAFPPPVEELGGRAPVVGGVLEPREDTGSLLPDPVAERLYRELFRKRGFRR